MNYTRELQTSLAACRSHRHCQTFNSEGEEGDDGEEDNEGAEA